MGIFDWLFGKKKSEESFDKKGNKIECERDDNEDGFKKELKVICSKFDKKIHNSKKVEDLDYWYSIIQTRAKNDNYKFPDIKTLTREASDKKNIELEKKLYEFIWGHAE